MGGTNNGFIYEKDSDGIVVVTMDMEGSVNTMNHHFRLAMAKTLDTLEAEQNIRGVVFASAKKTFFAGGDLGEFLAAPKGEEEGQFFNIETSKAFLRRLEKLPVPVVAAINGSALGGGLEICLACNYRIALNSNRVLIGLPEVTLGLLPGGGGVVRSIHMLGLEKALPLLLEGKLLKPAQALEAGFVNALVDDPAQLVEQAKSWITENPQAAIQPWDQKGHRIPFGDHTDPAITNILSVSPAQLLKKTRGLLPAPERILAVAGETVTVDFDTALRYESRNLAYLITTAQAKNIITANFYQLNSINRGISRPTGVDSATVKKVGILGAGMMGQGIAYSAAAAGLDVVLKDISIEAAEKGKAYTAKVLDKKIKRGSESESNKAAVLERILATDDYSQLQGCDLIIEAVFENMELKSRVIQEAEQYLVEGGIFASNTSTLPISQLSEASNNAENFIGIHFFSPVDKMSLVEIICGDQTSDRTLATAFDFARLINKTPIVVNDFLGFFTSRVFGSFMDEGARLLVEGIDPVLIDALGKQVGMPVGPLAVQDEVSQELTHAVAETHRSLGVFGSLADSHCNTEVSERMIDEFGRGGRFHGGGYYDYPADAPKQIWPTLYELYHKPELDMPHQDIKDRILFRQVVESLKCLQEGVLNNVADGNIGSLLAIGAPTWTGGFLQFVNTYEYQQRTGLDAFTVRCQELEAAYGERFQVPAIVQEKIKSGELFN